MNTNEQFRLLLKKHGMSIKEIAYMIETPYETVRNWTRDCNAKGYRLMPNYALIAVKLSIEQKSREE